MSIYAYEFEHYCALKGNTTGARNIAIGAGAMDGTAEDDAKTLLADAKALQEAGVFSIVLEMVAAETTKHITEAVFVPTIGIGCGKDCDGQVLVIHDMLGLFEKLKPKFVKKYLSLSEEIKKAVSEYVKNVENRTFPAEEHTFHIEVQK